MTALFVPQRLQKHARISLPQPMGMTDVANPSDRGDRSLELAGPQAGFEPATLGLTGGTRSGSRSLPQCAARCWIAPHHSSKLMIFDLRPVPALAVVCRRLVHGKGKKRATCRRQTRQSRGHRLLQAKFCVVWQEQTSKTICGLADTVIEAQHRGLRQGLAGKTSRTRRPEVCFAGGPLRRYLSAEPDGANTSPLGGISATRSRPAAALSSRGRRRWLA